MGSDIPDRDDCVRTAADLGRLIRARRKALQVDQADLAGFAGAGVRFLSELERGKTTAHIGKVLAVLDALGLEIAVRSKRGGSDGR